MQQTFETKPLKQLYKEFKEKESRDEQIISVYAKRNNIDIIQKKDNGSFTQLMRLAKDGSPIYYELDNVDAAVSTRANFLNTGGGLGLNLDGARNSSKSLGWRTNINITR